MIGELRGTVADSGGRWVLRDAAGVGWAISLTFPAADGDDLTVYVTTVWRESTGPELWAHNSLVDRDMFEALCSVHGVGPSIAGSIIRSLGAAGVADAVHRSDSSPFRPVRGVGPKMAGRIISDVELPESARTCGGAGPVGIHDELTTALVDLGFAQEDAQAAVAAVRAADPDATDEAVLGAALASLSGQ
jgi:Holliday junction DNA helicase RuvA